MKNVTDRDRYVLDVSNPGNQGEAEHKMIVCQQ